jgi:hypothetical protein
LATTKDRESESRLCSAFSTANSESAGGSAFSWKRSLMVEVPEPWDGQIIRSRHFPQGVFKAVATADGSDREAKLHCILPDDEYSRPDHTRVILFSRPKGHFSRFDKDDFLVPTEKVLALAEAIVSSDRDLSAFEEYRQDTAATRDILVCTHGSHDTCCGTFGYPIYDRLRNGLAREAGSNLRVFRVSHLGGHRFAPNFVDMPEGRNWVRMGVGDVDDLLLRRRAPSELKLFHRGWAGLDTPQEQSAEQEIFMREGWEWTTRDRSGTVVEAANDGSPARVRIDYAGANSGGSGSYEATVEQIEDAPRVECPSGERSGSWWQFKVTELERISQA